MGIGVDRLTVIAQMKGANGMNESHASPGRIVVLGRRNENQARCVMFDIVEWQRTYGEGTVQLLAQRPQEDTPYPCAVTVENGLVRWVIKEADVAMPGEGKAELRYYVGETVAVSDTYRTWVLPSLGEAGSEPPAPEQSWVETVLQAARDAEQSAQNARNAVTQTITIGESGNWFIDGEDTGVRASGSQGERGESGVYCGSEEPGDDCDVWIDPAGGPSLPDFVGDSGIRIDLMEYGLNLTALLNQAVGTTGFDRAPEVFALVNANPEANITFVIRTDSGEYVEMPVTKIGALEEGCRMLSSGAVIMFDGTLCLANVLVVAVDVRVDGDSAGSAVKTITELARI